jgi:gas vesicle protein
MSTDPDVIRADIERTRSNLSSDVNALADEVNPKNVVRRKTQKVTGAFGSVRDSVMGTAAQAQDTAGDAVQTVGDAAANAPTQVARRTKGNPLAAGLIAFGVGALLSSLIPASDRERSLAAEAKDKAQPLVDETKQIAQDAASELKEPAQQAAEAVKQSAADAAATVKDEGRSAASDVRGAAAGE